MSVRSRVRLSLSVLFVSVVSVFAQPVPGRYVVELSGAPAARGMSPRDARFTARRAAVRQTQTAARRNIAARGGRVLESLDTVMNALIVSIPDARAAELRQLPGVAAVYSVRRVMAHLDHALPLHKVNDAWAALPLGRDGAGAGIKIGHDRYRHRCQ